MNFTVPATLAIALAAGTALAHDGHHGDEQTERSQVQRPPQHRQMESIELPAPEVTITIEGKYRVIRSNGIPNHMTGTFPNNENPNALRPQQHEYRVPLVPTLSGEPISARPEFGIGVNGVIFDAGTGEFWTAEQGRAFGGGSGWNYEALGGGVPFGLDVNHAHVQPTGKYHYHGIPTGLLDSLTGQDRSPQMVQLGWAYDGFPIYGPHGYSDPTDPTSELRTLRSSYRLKSGSRPDHPEGPGGTYDGTFGMDYEYVDGSGDLDECNGRFGVTPEYPKGTYYYIITEDFPAIPRLWRGVPDPTARRGPPGGERRGPRGGPGGPPGPERGGPPRS